jgi:pyruvate/2-oxoglutarate dehydrogenase complex dihydrolipoamide dehydrogenase (E3) component
MLPATIVYVNAGTQLAAVRSARDIASPGLIGSLVLLSLLPLIGKFVADRLRRRRVYRGWKRPRRFDRNLIVIGAGAGGLVTSYVAAAVRAKVTLIESHRMGGDCLNTGCVPSKALIRSARAAHEARSAARLGIEVAEPRIDFAAVIARMNRVIADIAPADSVERYTALGVDVRRGWARIIDPWTVEVNGERITSRAIVVATGGEPVVPDLPGIAQSDYFTSDTMWEALSARPDLPERLVVLGGGPIGVEMAQAFVRLGSRVTLIQTEPRLLTREDGDAAAAVAAVLAREGVDLRCGHQAVRCENGTIVARSGGEEHVFAYDMLLLAVGRRPRLSGYGLEGLGIGGEDGLETNGWLETRFPNIYVVGDAEGSYQFTHAAAHQGWHAAVNALFGSLRRFRVDYRVLPRVTFTEPELATVGETEASATRAGIAFETVRYPLSHHDRALTEEAAEGFVKFLLAPGKDRIIGAVIVGHNAGELIATAALAMKHGIGLNKLLGTVTAYPTMAEALKLAAGQWRREHAPERLLGWLETYHRWRRG